MSGNTIAVSATVNGDQVRRMIAARTTLAEFLRDELGLTGTKVSCEMQVCGVCTVLVDSMPVSACTYLAIDIDDRQVATIEGLAPSPVQLHPIQEAFIAEFALQCGFCTPGFIMATKALLDETSMPSSAEVIHYLEGNICRCTGYQPIVKAVMRAAEAIERGRDASE